MSNKQKIVRISPLNAVVFACFFRDAEKAGKAMLDFLNAVLKHVGEETIVEILDMKSELLFSERLQTRSMDGLTFA